MGGALARQWEGVSREPRPGLPQGGLPSPRVVVCVGRGRAHLGAIIRVPGERRVWRDWRGAGEKPRKWGCRRSQGNGAPNVRPIAVFVRTGAADIESPTNRDVRHYPGMLGESTTMSEKIVPQANATSAPPYRAAKRVISAARSPNGTSQTSGRAGRQAGTAIAVGGWTCAVLAADPADQPTKGKDRLCIAHVRSFPLAVQADGSAATTAQVGEG